MKNKYPLLKAILPGICLSLCASSLMAQPGTPDPGFVYGTGFVNGSSPGYITALALQPDGKILAGGEFTGYNGTGRNNIIRLNADGSQDPTFSPGTGFDGPVNALLVQPDGKILAGGAFAAYNGNTANGLIRLNANGTPDGSFNTGTGFEGKKGGGQVSALARQSDGKIVVSGNFTGYNGTARTNLVRLSDGGVIDAAFTTELNQAASTVLIQSDGKILLAGSFTTVNSATANRIARLSADGTIDATFTPGTGFDGSVSGLALQSDGKIVAGGSFNAFGGTSCAKIARLNSNGTLDATFNTGSAFGSDYVFSVAMQPDGKIFVGGNYTHYNGAASRSLVRIHPDGARDTAFKVGTGFINGAISGGQVPEIVLQPDGKLLAAGIFTAYNGLTTSSIIRINAYTPALQILALSPATGYCPGSRLTVNYAAGTGSFNPGNVFTAQLSNASGSFAAPVNIGTLTGVTDGFIQATIPVGTPAGAGYRIRVISNNPALTGSNNGSDLAIGSGTAPTVTASASKTSLCAGESVTLTASGNAGSYSWNNGVSNGVAFTPSATNTYTVTGTSGTCNNSDLITVTVNPLPSVQAQASEDTVCKGSPIILTGAGANNYTWDNGASNGMLITINATTTFTVTGTDANGCKNTDRITITALEPAATALSAAICRGDSYQLGAQSLNTAGTFTETFAGAAINGCDSIVTLTLSVSPEDITVSLNDRTLTANQAGASYQWINCDNNNSPITGATGQSFTPNLPGTFAVIVTQNGCSDTSGCHTIWPAGISRMSGNMQVRLYPNPVTSTLNIEGEISSVSVQDITGKTLLQYQADPYRRDHVIHTESWSAGLYLIRVFSGTEMQVFKISKGE